MASRKKPGYGRRISHWLRDHVVSPSSVSFTKVQVLSKNHRNSPRSECPLPDPGPRPAFPLIKAPAGPTTGPEERKTHLRPGINHGDFNLPHLSKQELPSQVISIDARPNTGRAVKDCQRNTLLAQQTSKKPLLRFSRLIQPSKDAGKAEVAPSLNFRLPRLALRKGSRRTTKVAPEPTFPEVCIRANNDPKSFDLDWDTNPRRDQSLSSVRSRTSRQRGSHGGSEYTMDPREKATQMKGAMSRIAGEWQQMGDATESMSEYTTSPPNDQGRLCDSNDKVYLRRPKAISRIPVLKSWKRRELGPRTLKHATAPSMIPVLCSSKKQELRSTTSLSHADKRFGSFHTRPSSVGEIRKGRHHSLNDEHSKADGKVWTEKCPILPRIGVTEPTTVKIAQSEQRITVNPTLWGSSAHKGRKSSDIKEIIDITGNIQKSTEFTKCFTEKGNDRMVRKKGSYLSVYLDHCLKERTSSIHDKRITKPSQEAREKEVETRITTPAQPESNYRLSGEDELYTGRPKPNLQMSKDSLTEVANENSRGERRRHVGRSESSTNVPWKSGICDLSRGACSSLQEHQDARLNFSAYFSKWRPESTPELRNIARCTKLPVGTWRRRNSEGNISILRRIAAARATWLRIDISEMEKWNKLGSVGEKQQRAGSSSDDVRLAQAKAKFEEFCRTDFDRYNRRNTRQKRSTVISRKVHRVACEPRLATLLEEDETKQTAAKSHSDKLLVLNADCTDKKGDAASNTHTLTKGSTHQKRNGNGALQTSKEVIPSTVKAEKEVLISFVESTESEILSELKDKYKQKYGYTDLMLQTGSTRMKCTPDTDDKDSTDKNESSLQVVTEAAADEEEAQMDQMQEEQWELASLGEWAFICHDDEDEEEEETEEYLRKSDYRKEVMIAENLPRITNQFQSVGAMRELLKISALRYCPYAPIEKAVRMFSRICRGPVPLTTLHQTKAEAVSSLSTNLYQKIKEFLAQQDAPFEFKMMSPIFQELELLRARQDRLEKYLRPSDGIDGSRSSRGNPTDTVGRYERKAGSKRLINVMSTIYELPDEEDVVTETAALAGCQKY
ncbi:uncharacterized protein LOC110988476 isoform X2 [Acanthaster planci]|uniref:Uncharacterized protein LOC110988476 isoform X2 n=1 Tax=Acanthaster planci TaxID=133434 RepID=A0A8B7ZVY6_ACAPL|nr:uncharacterized protein LOC110988476 isoform X2 [Acanthaster planci]